MTTNTKRTCLCGCGEPPSPGAVVGFADTHDAKLNRLLTEVKKGILPGRVIPEVLLERARGKREGSTAKFSHEDILRLCGKVI